MSEYSSEFAKPAPEGFDSSPPTVKQIIKNRLSNRINFKNSPLPKADRVLVVGAGKSADELLIPMGITFNGYDYILITHPMASLFKNQIKWNTTILVVDGDFLETTSHFYGDFKENVWLICPWEKELNKDWKFRNTTFLMPEGEPNWDKRARISPNYPKSTGAIALQVALEDMGGDTIVDVIGIDCTGQWGVYKDETMNIINKHRDRVNLINCGIGD